MQNVALLIAVLFGLAPAAFAQDCCEKSSTSEFRLARRAPVSSNFRGLPAFFTQRWLRNFGSPSFCPFILCNGGCASGDGFMGASDVMFDEAGNTFVLSSKTPCGIGDLGMPEHECGYSPRLNQN
jgi:hypothetical protein